jgi:hypothetical protein
MKKDLSEIADEVSISGVKERHRQRIAKSQNMVISRFGDSLV